MATDLRFNVACRACSYVWTPAARSPLWWRAKKWNDQGKLDAIHVSGEDCGCIEQKQQCKPGAPYRVFGFDDECREFDIPFTSFTDAVKEYRSASRSMCTVFISGVSPAVASTSRNIANCSFQHNNRRVTC